MLFLEGHLPASRNLARFDSSQRLNYLSISRHNTGQVWHNPKDHYKILIQLEVDCFVNFHLKGITDTKFLIEDFWNGIRVHY